MYGNLTYGHIARSTAHGSPKIGILATSMTFVRNVVWTHTQIYDSNKRKHDAISPEDPISDGMSAEESMYNTARLAMTPTTMEPGATHPMEPTVAAMTPTAAEEGEEEKTISHDAAMYEAAIAAMTPKTQEDTSSPSPERGL